MPKTQNRAVMIWLFIFVFMVAFLVVYGGYVRLTRSGLSIVEWNPVEGAIPPLNESAWEAEFAKYQLTPEYQKINRNMTLEAYQRIFYIEWFHRFFARLVGIFYAIPVFYYLFKGHIPRKEFGIYALIGFLYIGQAFLGWFMVASGLIDRPAVSHIRLTLHLLLALALFGLSFWVALGHRFGFPESSIKAKWSRLSKLALAGMGVLLIQISYGGFTAGLNAGYVSNTWPRMFGSWIPSGLFDNALDFIQAPITIVFIHRWFAFLALIFIIYLYIAAKKANYPREITNAILGLIGLGCAQIAIGVLVVLSQVQMPLALLHQATAVLLFGFSIFFMQRLRALDYGRF
ncbi:MAG: COX15/CtaA family protein [Anaerolineae bacterium]|nr:COX15/CtaA family protein [Anaerolineae bacterium]